MNLQLSGNKLLYHLDALRKWQEGRDFYPLNLEIGPTSACNVRCVHCYVQHLEHKRVYLPDDAYLNLITDIITAKIKAIVFCGTGEPLLHKKTPEAIVLAEQGGIDVGMITNGTLLTPSVAKQILPKMTWMRFSILGIKEETYNKLHGIKGKIWERLYSNLEEASRLKRENGYKVTFGVSCALMPENGHEIHLMAKKFSDLGFDYFVIRPVGQDMAHAIVADTDLSKRFEKELEMAENYSSDTFKVVVRRELFGYEEDQETKRHYEKCLALPFLACVDADGSLYTCNGRWGEEDYTYGNINQKSFLDIWNSPEHKKKMKNLMATTDVKTCGIVCRQNSMNELLQQISDIPDHVNFL
ncbi:radical SAM protein [Patescibacteria group bacterium]